MINPVEYPAAAAIVDQVSRGETAAAGMSFEDRMLGRYRAAKREERDLRRYYNAMNARWKGTKRRTRRVVALVRKIVALKKDAR